MLLNSIRIYKCKLLICRGSYRTIGHVQVHNIFSSGASSPTLFFIAATIGHSFKFGLIVAVDLTILMYSFVDLASSTNSKKEAKTYFYVLSVVAKNLGKQISQFILHCLTSSFINPTYIFNHFFASIIYTKNQDNQISINTLFTCKQYEILTHENKSLTDIYLKVLHS